MPAPAAPRTPVSSRTGGRGPGTPSVNRLAMADRGGAARVERGEEAPVEASYAQSTRAWRSGGDRKIMFENRGGHALIPPARRPGMLVFILHICAWFLLAAGMFQIVLSKSSDFKYPSHWVGVAMVLLGLVAGLVRVRTNRCGIKPEWAALIAVGTAAACLASALLADGPLLEELMTARECTANNVWELCGIDKVEDDLGNLADPNVCVCKTAPSQWNLCVDFTSGCDNIMPDRRYVHISLISLWVGLGLSSLVAVLALRIVATTYDAGAIAEANEKTLQKERARAEAQAPFAV